VVWRREDPQGNEAAKVKYDIVPYTRGRGLDLGCGPFKTFNHFIGVDNKHHHKRFGWQDFEPDVVVDTCERLDLFADKSMDFVFSSHLLEHIEHFEDALREWWRVIKPGGHLVLYLPHRDFYPNIGQPGANPDHKHDFWPADIVEAMLRVASGESGWDLLENEERNEGREYSFFQVYRRRNDGRCVEHPHPWKKPGSKNVCVVRYGGFGDMIQTSSILPALKDEGWHVTVMTTPKGYDILKADPHVDRFLLQDGNPDQVPNGELGAFWATWEKKFDRWINLSESVEGTLLAIPGRTNHSWPDSLRRELLNQNYLEFTHKIAQVPMPPRPAFYQTDEEFEWAAREILPFGKDAFLVMVVLAGSSVHKAYPHMDNVVGRLLRAIPEAKVIFVGDYGCQILEAGWEKDPRVMCRSGVWSIRQSLVAARECDLVIGPETGVLNAVAYTENSKIVLLSHSSVENLTRDWKNTVSMLPAADVKCYPCHRLHYSRDHCPEWRVPVANHPISSDVKLLNQMAEAGHVVDGLFATGAALCAASISPDDICEAIERIHESWRTHRTIPAAG